MYVVDNLLLDHVRYEHLSTTVVIFLCCEDHQQNKPKCLYLKDTLCPFSYNPTIYLGWMGKGDQSMTFLQLLEHTFNLLVWWGVTVTWDSDFRLVIADSDLSINTHVIAIRLRCWNVDNSLTKILTSGASHSWGIGARSDALN